MSDYIQYTLWQQREGTLVSELEQHRATAERLAADEVAARQGGGAVHAHSRRAHPVAVALRGLVRAAR